MIALPFQAANNDSHPLDLVEDLAEKKGWAFTRHDDNTLTFSIKGQLATYEVEMEWQDEFSALTFACALQLPVKEEYMSQAAYALQDVNENLWLGHFDLSAEDNKPVFRYTMLLRLIPDNVAVEMVADLADLAIAECDRFYTSFKMLAEGDVRMNDALNAAIFETVGEA